MKKISLAIIGAGPAGLLAAYAAGNSALLLEANPYAGKKLLLSGSGQCNYSNNLPNDDFLSRMRENAYLLKPALYSFDSTAFKTLLENYGCDSFTREDGKVFPASLKSSDVRDALLKAALSTGAELQFDTKINAVEKKGNEGFLLKTSIGDILAQKLVLACGGMSYAQTGSDGGGYLMAKSLGHKISPPRPALTSLELTEASRLFDCAGLGLKNVSLSLCSSTGKVVDKGDLLFTHTGLSGPVILNNSYLLKPGTSLALNIVTDAHQRIQVLVKKAAKKHLRIALKELDLAQCLIDGILKHLEIDGETRMAELRAQDRRMLEAYLQNAVLHVKKMGGFDDAMATAGGISLGDVNIRKMESKICRGLYIAGEMLDYHAPTGGFNIQLAASTGFLAGQSAAASLL